MSEVKVFCTECWREVREEDTVCPSCGSSLSAFNDLTYDEKLMKALLHFEPQTAMRAAEILAMRKSKPGADAIAQAYVNRADLDPIMARAFIRAIANILGEDDADVAAGLNKRGNFRSAVASRIVEVILQSLGDHEKPW